MKHINSLKAGAPVAGAIAGSPVVVTPKAKLSPKLKAGAPVVASGLAVGMIATPAFAAGGQDLGNLASGWNTQFQTVGKTVLNGCTLVGVGVAGAGLLELKRSQDPNNQGRDNAKSAGTKMMVGGGLAAISAIVNVGISTIFSGGGGSTSVTQGNLNFN